MSDYRCPYCYSPITADDTTRDGEALRCLDCGERVEFFDALGAAEEIEEIASTRAMKLNHTCACQDDDPYLCWAKRYSLAYNATSTIRAAVTNDGGPCLCRCHDEDEWADELISPDATASR